MDFFTDAVKSGFFCYMAEAEGLDYLVNTRIAKLNAVKKELRKPGITLEEACLNHGITSISEDELYELTGDYNYVP